MLCFPNCKINIGLYVTNRRADGYHDLETVFFPVQLTDILEVVPGAASQIHLTGKNVAGDNKDNLVWKALQLLQKEYPDKITPVDIFLHKNIPMGAGLGGGSADGAFMLRLLNDFFSLGIDKQRLAELALLLGSDCPFFIYNSPKYATSRGEKMEDIDLDLSAYSIQLVCPQVHVSTGAAFQMIRPGPANLDLRELKRLPVETWKDQICNDFEAPVFAQYHALAGIKAQLYQQGAVYAAMSGSGSTLYGIFPKGKQATISADVPCDLHYIE